ncbi:hypothetical protein [Halosolutus halophilus]|uniref:hypothetical protein n=1 Tax=Halosolutus halophilus TaxID=1552990 RepID=UPI0022351897|nr:hypothetical protein [Halosolutus halophilus]
MSKESFSDTADSTESAPPSQMQALNTETADTAALEETAQLELLAEENRRLREEYARARQSRYRRTAIGLAAVGVVALAGGLLFPDTRAVFVALGATGVFGAVLTYSLTPGQFVAAAVGERVYAASAANGAAIAAELGLSDERLYLPPTQARAVQLYVPLHRESDAPAARDGPFVLEEPGRGLLLDPTGGTLFAEFERALAGDLASTPEPLARQLCDGLVEQFELAAGAEPDVDADAGRVTVAVSNSAFGAVDRFDHPIGSFLAVGLAQGLDRSVELEVDVGDERADWLVTCRYDGDPGAQSEFEWGE